MLNFVTPELFDMLVLINIGVGLIWAAYRLYKDFTRPQTDDDERSGAY